MSDIIKEMTQSNSLDNFIAHNERIRITLKDYDLIKRTLPQVYKILKDIHTSIINPEVLSDKNFLIEKSTDPSEAFKTAVEKLQAQDGYRINEKINDIVEDYLIISKAYYLVTPYNMLPDMLNSISGNPDFAYSINESAVSNISNLFESGSLDATNYDLIESGINNFIETQTLHLKKSNKSILESVNLNESTVLNSIENYNKSVSNESNNKKLSEELLKESKSDNYYKELNKEIETFMETIEIIQGPFDIYKEQILSEAAARNDFISNSKINSIKRKVSAEKDKRTAKYIAAGDMNIKKMKKMDLKGCFVEKLNPSRVIPIIAKSGRKIGYFYIREDLAKRPTNYLFGADQGLFNSLNKKMVNKMDDAGNIPHVISQEISRRLLSNINPSFVKDNIDNMDEIFEFVQEFIIKNTKDKRKVHFIHSDDIVEFSRPDGSIMKYSIIMARLAILLIMNNIMTKVTNGADKTIYYMDMSISTDIAKSVEDSINSIIDSRITMDSITSVENIFGTAASSADIFVPRAGSSGYKPIEAEIMSGQDVEMDEEFIKFLIDNTLLGFGIEPAALDYTSNVEYAKTLSMVDIRIAKNALNEQKIINPALERLIKKILYYELGDDNSSEIEKISIKLQPPKIVMLEMLEDIFSTVNGFAETLSSILIGDGKDEELNDIRKRLLNKELINKFIPTLDMDEYEELIEKVFEDAKLLDQKNKISNKKADGDYDEDDDE